MNWYKTSQLDTQELKDKYYPLIQEFINENKDLMYDKILTDQQWALGTCGSVSKDLVNFFMRKNIKANMLECTGLKVPLPQDAHPDWQKFQGEDQQFLWHVVVETDDAIIDLTGGQYGKVFSGIQIKPKKDYLDNWKKNKTYKGY